MFKHFKKSFLIFLSLNILLPMYTMENRNTPSNNIYAPLATRIFPLLTTFLLYKYKQYKTNSEFGKAVCSFLLNNNQEENFQIIRKCIENGVDPNYKIGPDKTTSLKLAIWSSNKTLFNYLLQHGADVNSVDSNGRIAFSYLIGALTKEPEKFDAEIFQYLLKHTNPIIKPITGTFATPLGLMCSIKNNNLIKLFIKYGLDVNKEDSLGNTPLMYAVIFKNIEAIKEFCHAGASINTLDTDGNTIFHIAATQKLPKEHIRAFITHARFDSFNENQKEKEWKVLAALSVLSTLPKEIRFFILNKLTLIDDDYCSNKKLCKKLLDKGYTEHIINHVAKRINYINETIQIKNNEGKFVLNVAYESQDNQYIQDIKSLLNTAQLQEDLDAFLNKPITENNLVYQMSNNYIRLLKE